MTLTAGVFAASVSLPQAAKAETIKTNAITIAKTFIDFFIISSPFLKMWLNYTPACIKMQAFRMFIRRFLAFYEKLLAC